MSHVIKLPAVWTPLNISENSDPQNVLNQMEEILERWNGTPYGSGQRLCGVAADCIGFGTGAIDDIDGRPRAQDPSIPPDTALHDPKRSAAAVLALVRAYEPAVQVTNSKLQPFDLIVVGPNEGGPGHAMLVGPQRNTLWHCTKGVGVHKAGWCLGDGYNRLFAAYRMGDRERWL